MVPRHDCQRGEQKPFPPGPVAKRNSAKVRRPEVIELDPAYGDRTVPVPPKPAFDFPPDQGRHDPPLEGKCQDRQKHQGAGNGPD